MTYREHIESTLRATHRDTGIHVEYLHFGAPVDPAEIERVEREVLGGPMDPALRAFFLEMNGLQVCYWTTNAPSSDPLVVSTAGPLAWNVASYEDGPLWKKLRSLDQASIGLVCIPDLDTVFRTRWADIHSMPEGEEFLFDAFHHYDGCYLRLDRGTHAMTIGLASDHWVGHDHEEISVADYFEQIAQSVGQLRTFFAHGQKAVVRVR